MRKQKVDWAAILFVGQVAVITPAAADESRPASLATSIAKPLADPSQWVTTDDYPAAALKETRDGKVRFRLSVDVTGMATDCTVLVSSGSADLDLATCELTKQRARFAPARDAAGHPQPGTYTDTVDWLIPKMPPPQPSHVVTRYIVEADGTFSHCEVTEVDGVSKDLPVLGAFPCLSRAYSDGYVDAARHSVARQLTVTETVTVDDVLQPAPAQ